MIILSKWLNNSCWPIDGTLTGTTNPGHSGYGSNGHEKVLHIPQTSETGASSSVLIYWFDTKLRLMVRLLDTRRVGILPLCRGIVGVFYIPSWQSRFITYFNVLGGEEENGKINGRKKRKLRKYKWVKERNKEFIFWKLHTYTQTNTHTYIQTHTHIYTYIYIYIYVCVCVCVCVYVCVRTRACACLNLKIVTLED